MFVLMLLTSFFYFNELLSLVPRSLLNLKRYQIKEIIRTQDFISTSYAITISFLYFFFDKPWYINDIISLFFIGTILKLFKVTKLKYMVIVFSVWRLTETLYSLLIFFSEKYSISYDDYILIELNFPFMIQFPRFSKKLLNKMCTWIPFSVIFLPGILISYCYRFDS